MLKQLCSTLSVFFVVATATFFFGTMTTHAANCTQEQAILKARGQNIPCGYSQPSDLAVLSGGCPDAAGAIQFLKSRSKRPESIDKLTPEFACKLKEFIEQAPGHITIGVGTYTVTKSKAAGDDCTRYQCKEGSNTHPLGCAADLFYDGKCNNTAACAANPCGTIASCDWAHKNAEGKGLQYRLMPGHPRFPGTPEPWHIELKDGDLTRCRGGGTQTSPPGAQTPTSGLGDLFRQALGLPKQPPFLQPTPVALETDPTKTAAFAPSPADPVPAANTIAGNTNGNVPVDPAALLLKQAGYSTSPDPLKTAQNVAKTAVVISGTSQFTLPSPVGGTPLAGKTDDTASYAVQASFQSGSGGTPQAWYAPLLRLVTPFGGQPGGRSDDTSGLLL